MGSKLFVEVVAASNMRLRECRFDLQFVAPAKWQPADFASRASLAHFLLHPAGEAAKMMSEKNTTGLGRVLLVWVVGLALGIGAGALTARLLIPRSSVNVPAEMPPLPPVAPPAG
ncbi:MAG: hypothetical protein ACK4MX_04750 [Thermaurantiacus sp.]